MDFTVAMPDLWLPSQLQHITIFSEYQIIQLGKPRHMCVNNLPRVVAWQCTSPESNQQPRGHQFGMLPLHN